jgi:hypothetical protein
MRGSSSEHMLRRRDAIGDELAMLSRIANDPKPNPEEVTSYIRKLVQDGHVNAEDVRGLLASVPHDPDGLRAWARAVFPVLMHQGIHAHAAFPREAFPSPQQAPQQPQQAPAASPATPATE